MPALRSSNCELKTSFIVDWKRIITARCRLHFFFQQSARSLQMDSYLGEIDVLPLRKRSKWFGSSRKPAQIELSVPWSANQKERRVWEKRKQEYGRIMHLYKSTELLPSIEELRGLSWEEARTRKLARSILWPSSFLLFVISIIHFVFFLFPFWSLLSQSSYSLFSSFLCLTAFSWFLFSLLFSTIDESYC